MDSFFIIFISCIVFFVSMKLFKIASGGSLNIKKINMISFVFYNLIIFSFIGSILFALNLDNHYLACKIAYSDTRTKGWSIVQLVMILFPLNIIFINVLFNFNSKVIFQGYLEKETKCIFSTKDSYIFWPLLFLSILSVVSILYTFYCIGFSNLPFIKMISGASSYELAKSRIDVSRYFNGNIYIKNIFALGLTPIWSFIAYVYYKITDSNQWKRLFILLFVSSISINIYNLEKAPVIIYLFTFYVIRIYMGEEIRNKQIFFIFVLGVMSIVLMYVFIAKIPINQILSFRSGPLNRMFLGQIVGLFLHFDIFPKRFAFLKGASFPKMISEKLLGLQHIRSARLVMEIVNPSGVEENVAGVINTLFVAEAYANFGTKGIFISIICVSLIMDLFFILFMKLPKNPINIAMLSYFTISFTMILHGGFVDYIYNPFNILLVILMFIIYTFAYITYERK